MGDIRAAQLVLGMTGWKAAVGSLGIEVGDALEIAEQVDV